jgi:hypothetical protein
MEEHLTPLMEHVARQIEEEIDREGWDQPATLWSLKRGDQGRYVAQRECAFAEHPADALVGVRLNEVAGCAIVTEGWTYSEQKMSLWRKGRELKMPAAYADRVEVRHVYLLLESRGELLVQRVKGSIPEVMLVGDETVVSGRIVAAARRVMGLPSGVKVHAGVAQMRERALLASVLDAIEGLCADGCSVRLAMSAVERSCDRVKRIVDVMGLNAENWDDALEAAKNTGGLDIAVREFMQWADGAMWGERVEDSFEIAELTRERLGRVAVRHLGLLASIYEQLGLG